MAWTTPRTWTDGELVTKAIMDVHVRDNLNAARGTVIRKTGDTSRASTITPTDDPDLILPVVANDVFNIVWRLRITSASATPDFLCQFTFPAAGELGYHVAVNIAGAATVASVTTATSPTSQIIQDVSATNGAFLTISGLYVGGANAGNVTLQWSQNTSNATATVLKAQSNLQAWELV